MPLARGSSALPSVLLFMLYDLYKEMSLDSRSSKDKARKLVQAVTDKVKRIPPENISKFLIVIKKENMNNLEAALKSKLICFLGSPSSITHRKRISSASNKTRQIIYPKF